jgi:hypothetical protein
MILLERLSRIDSAIKNRAYAKFFHQDKIGQTCLFAFDESKRMLAVYASARVCICCFLHFSLGSKPGLLDATPCLRIRRRAQILEGAGNSN